MPTDALRRQALRPEGIRSRPLRMDRVFDDPEEVLRIVERRAPYRTMVAYLGHGVPGEGAAGIPWFLDRPDAAILVHNPRWIAAARQVFGAEIVRPIHVTLNVNGPSPLGPPHIDQPAFRGFADAEAPLWLLMAMSRSGLFLDWLVPVASGLVWFWRGAEGNFEYWPDGPRGASVTATRPMWNTGVMGDNEVMWHRVGAFGRPERQMMLAHELKVSAQANWTGGGWEIRQDGGVLMTLGTDEMRVALLWKAQVFRDEAHLASFEDERYNLDMEQVTGIFLADLAARGVVGREPTDPAGDDDWRALLERSYVTPFE
jgi:hypothetical protein